MPNDVQLSLVEEIKRALQMGGNQCLKRFNSFGDTEKSIQDEEQKGNEVEANNLM